MSRAMKTSRAGLLAIASHEGVVLSRYKDSVDVWTIGIGHTKNAGGVDPARVTRELDLSEVLQIFREDIPKYERRVNRAVTVPLEQHEFDALVSFDFNTGGIHKASLTRYLNAGNRSAAAKAFMNWSKPKEIIPRRRSEKELFRTGDYPEVTHLTVYPVRKNNRPNFKRPRRVPVPDDFMADEIKAPERLPDDPGPVTPDKPKGLAAAILAFLKDIIDGFRRG